MKKLEVKVGMGGTRVEMIDKDGSMVGVEKLESKTNARMEIRLYSRNISALVRFFVANNRISYVALKMGVGLRKDGRWSYVCRFRKAIRFRRSKIDTVFRPTFRFSRPTNDKRVSLGFVS